MASVRSTIDLVITGATRGLGAAAAEARAMAERVADAEDRVSAARERSAAAESRVADVEQRLAGARAQHTAALSQVGVAETNLQRVRERNQGVTTRLSQAEADLDRLRRGGGSAAQIEAAEQRVTRVRQESDRAAADLQRAEAQLERARGQASQRAGQVAALEQRLAQARGRAFQASEDLARAETRLGVIRRRGTDDINRQRDGVLGIFDAFSRLGQAFSGADGASTSLLAKLSALNSVITSIGGPIVQAIAGLAQFVAIASGAVVIIGVIGGVIGQALGGAPALLFAVAAAAGTVALGMDGIKKAAEVVQPALDKLKASVSGVFQRELTPAFRELAAVLPKLTTGFNFVASAVAGLITNLLQVVTSARGIQDIQRILAGTATLISALGIGVGQFAAALLHAAAAAGPAFRDLGVALSSVFERLADVFNRLADNGTIQAAVKGLAATIDGLGAVIAPVVELLLRMGAALGTSLGPALSDLGRIIQTTIPFFEEMARFAGAVLVDAFQQLSGPIENLARAVFPDFQGGLQGIAGLFHNVVLPAIAGFINFLTSSIPTIERTFNVLLINLTSVASQFLSFASTALGAFRALALGAALLTGNSDFLKLADQIGAAKQQVDAFKTTVDSVHDKKTVQLILQTVGTETLPQVKTSIDGIQSKVVQIVSKAFGLEDNQKLKGSIDAVNSKTVTTTSNVFGTNENTALRAAIDRVIDKTTKTVSNVAGTQENLNLRAAIDRVIDKTVSVVANVSGTGAVQALVGAINAVHNATATVTTYVRQIVQQFASGGRAPGGVPILVGEQGPELITLPPGGGFVHTAAQTRAMLRRGAGISLAGDANVLTGGSGGQDPITVTVNLSQQVIAGIAEVVVQRRDRTTRRTVQAGSGATF